MSAGASGNESTLCPKFFASAMYYQVVEQLRKMNLFDLVNLVDHMQWDGGVMLKYETVLQAVNADEYQVLQEYLISETGENIMRKNFAVPKRTFCINGPIRLCDNYHYIYQQSTQKLGNILALEGNTGIYGLYAPRFSGKTTFLIQLIPFLEHWQLEVACITCCRQFKPRSFAELGEKAMTSITKSSLSTDLVKARAREWLAKDKTTRPENFLEFLCGKDLDGKKVVILWDDFDFISDNTSIIASISSMFVDLQNGFIMGDYRSFRAVVLFGSHPAAFSTFGILPRMTFGPEYIRISPGKLFKTAFSKDFDISIPQTLYTMTDGHAGVMGIIGDVLEPSHRQGFNAVRLILIYNRIVDAIYRHHAFRGMIDALEKCGSSTKEFLLDLCATKEVAINLDSAEHVNLLRIGFATIKEEEDEEESIAVPSDFIRILAWKALSVTSPPKPFPLNLSSFWADEFRALCDLLGKIRPEIMSNWTPREVPLTTYTAAIAEVVYRTHKLTGWTVVPLFDFWFLVFYDNTAFGGSCFVIRFCESYECMGNALSKMRAELDSALGAHSYSLVIVSRNSNVQDVEHSTRRITDSSIYELYHDQKYKNAKLCHRKISHMFLKNGRFMPHEN